MTQKTSQLLGWIGGQLHAAATSVENGGGDQMAAAFAVACVLRRLSDDIEQMLIHKQPGVTMPTLNDTRRILKGDA